MIWEILKIEATKDKRAITRAYREQLTQVNPEEKPEEFMALREAYEEALRLADMEDQPEAEQKEKTELDLWREQLEDVYFDINKRRNTECWEELFDQDICQRLDTKGEVEETMLVFFMENYKVPHEVWLVIDKHFDLYERLGELSEKYPELFVKYVIKYGLEREDVVPYELFSPDSDGKAVDEYINLFLDASNIRFEEAAEIYARMEELPVSHPHAESLKCRFDFSQGDESACERLEAIHEAYPDDNHISVDLGFIYYAQGRYEEVIAICDKILETAPKRDAALNLKMYSHAELKQFKEAVDVINKLMDYAGGDIKRQYELDATRKEWNVELIKQYEAKTAENPEDYEAQCNLAWCYVQNEEYDKAVEMVPSLGVNYPNEAKYLYQVFGIYASAKMVDECREVLGKIYALAESISEDRTEEIEYLERKLPTLALQEISLNIILERDAEAIAAAEEAMAKFPENEEVASQVARLYLYFRCFEKAAETAMRIIQIQPDAPHGYFLFAVANFHMHRDSDAFNAINQAIDLDGMDLSAYFLKLRLLARNNAVEPAEELINFLEENGIEDDITIEWCKYQLDEFKELPAEEMFERVKAIIEEAEKDAEQDENNKVEWLSEAYYRMAVKLASIKDVQQDYDRKDLIEILDKGIAADPKEFDCHEYKAWLLKIDEKYDQALEIYKELEVRPRTNLYIESQLAEVYYESSYTDADKSLHYYRIVEEDEGDSRLYNLNVSYLELISGDFSGAEKHLDKALEIVPDDAWIYFRYAQLYLVENKLDKALEAALKSIELIKQLPQDRWRALYWDQLGQVYLRMGRVEDAVQTYKECKEVCSNYIRYMKDVFEALEYNGRWEELEQHIELWMKSEPADKWADSVAHYYLVSSQFDKLKKFMRKNKKHISSSQYGMISAKLTALKGEFDENELFREGTLKIANQSGGEHYTYNYSKLAMAYWLNDKPEMAKDAARRTIEEFGKYQKLFDLYAPIQHGCVSIAYAILGDYDKAWAALEDMKNAPFCDSCKYSVCKDVFIYKAEIETIAGDIEAAKESMDTLYEADPSEESLILLEAYLIKKGLM